LNLTSAVLALARTMTNPTPINRFAPFDPVRVREIIRAFDEACQALPDQPPPDRVRDALAKRITELAQFGEWSYERLRDQAVEYVKSQSAQIGES
jgi:hypothetical protein